MKMKYSEITLTDRRIIRKYLHPIRLEISLILTDMKPRTVQMIARKLGMDHGKIYYHMKVLEDLKLVRVVKTIKINNITARYYKRVYTKIFIDKHFDLSRLPEYQVIKRSALANILRNFFLEVVPPLDNTRSNLDEDLIIHHASVRLNKNDFGDLEDEILNVFKKYESTDEKDHVYTALFSVALPVNKR